MFVLSINSMFVLKDRINNVIAASMQSPEIILFTKVEGFSIIGIVLFVLSRRVSRNSYGGGPKI